MQRIQTESLDILLDRGILVLYETTNDLGDPEPYLSLAAEARRAFLGLPSADRVIDWIRGKVSVI